jgi:peptidyl-prolyl cis-trans isomerase SurA
VISSPDTTGGRTLTGADAQVTGVDAVTGLAKISAPAAPGTKGKHVKREKIRFGQAPRNSLPAGSAEAATTDASTPAAVAPVAPGAVMASNSAAASSETANLQDNPLTPQAPARTKTRFSSQAQVLKEKKATTVTAKQAEKVIAKPVAMTAEDKVAAQTQAAPLGLAGDTVKKPKKPKKVKGAEKKRLEDKPSEPKPVAPTVDQTVNPALAPTAVAPAATPPAATPPQK